MKLLVQICLPARLANRLKLLLMPFRYTGLLSKIRGCPQMIYIIFLKEYIMINHSVMFVKGKLLIFYIFLSAFFLQNNLIAQTPYSSNLPLVVLNTSGKTIKDEPKITVHMGIIDNGAGALNSPTDSFNVYDGLANIEIRGNSSQGFPKKSYGFETIDSLGEKLNVTLLGLPEENDWVLYAPYSDKSLIRNSLIFQLSGAMGNYAPRTKFCELFLNNNYQGVYVLTEKIKQDKNRVDIAKLKIEDISGDELTGGYILKIDWPEDGNGWYTNYAHAGDGSTEAKILYVDPKADKLVDVQKNYIRNYINQFEKVLKSADFKDPGSGYQKYIDVRSFYDFIIGQELANNVDAYSLSTFFYKDKDSNGGKLVMGPLWDFDLAFGNSDYGGEQGTFSFDSYLDPAPKWFTRIMEDDNFNNQMKCRWQELREDILETENVMSIIDSMALLLRQAQQRNNDKWNLYGRYIWPNVFIGKSQLQEINYLKSWTTERFEWLDDNLPGTCSSADGQNIRELPVGFSLYPNPNKGRFTVSCNEPGYKVVFYEIINFQGNIIETGKLSSGVTEINDPGLTPGVYIFRLMGEGSFMTKKFIVQ